MIAYLGSLPGAIAQGLIWGLMAIGVYITYKILDIADLTVDGSICTGGAVVTVLVVNCGWNIYAAMVVAIIAGILTGILTGLFHTLLGIPAILAGILTQLILWSVNLKIMGRANMALPSRNFDVLLSSRNPVTAIIIMAVILIIFIALLYWFFGTEIGSAIRATGCNPHMSHAQGINTNLKKTIGLGIANGIVALSGGLLVQYQGFADINMGRGAVVIGLAAVIIGEALISKMSSHMLVRLSGVIVGSIIYWFVFQTVIFIGLDADLLKMLSAIVVAIFLGIPYLNQTFFKTRKAAAKNKGQGENGHA